MSKKKRTWIMITLFFMIQLIPVFALADSYDAATKTVTIDTAPATYAGLQNSVQAVLGGDPESGILKLIITNGVGSYVLGESDQRYLGDSGSALTSLTHLDVASGILMNGNDDGTMGDIRDIFLSNNTIVSVTLPGTSAGTNTLFSCANLEEVTMPELQATDSMFLYNCTSIKTVSLAAATSIGASAFQGCSSLINVSLPLATSFGNYSFQYCTSLSDISLPSAQTFGMYSFRGCTSLSNISLPSATSLGARMFYTCTQPISLTLGATVPTADSSITVPTGSVLRVSGSAYTAYDTDPNDTQSPGSDGYWYRWRLVDITSVVSNPQTGEVSWFYKVIEWFCDWMNEE